MIVSDSRRRIVAARISGVALPFVDRPYTWFFGKQNGASALVITLTDEAGRSGWGEVPLTFHPIIPGQAMEMMAQSLLDLLVIGNLPMPRKFRATAVAHAGWHFYPHMGALIISGIEMALWDLLGRQLEVHVTELLGGTVRDAVECMWFVFDAEPEAMAAAARDGVAKGYRCYYLKWIGSVPKMLEKLRAVADQLPQDAVLRVDPNEAWTRASAVRYLRLLEGYPIEFVEQPLPRYARSGLAHLASRSRVPIAGDQGSRTTDEAFETLRAGGVDVLSVAPSDAGGILPAVEIAAFAEASGVSIFLHSNVETGIGQAALAAIGCVAANCSYASQTEYPHLASDFVIGLEFEGPCLKLPTRTAGLGFALDEEAFAAAEARYNAGEGNLATVQLNRSSLFIPGY